MSERFYAEFMPISSMPAISLDEIANKRYDLILNIPNTTNVIPSIDISFTIDYNKDKEEKVDWIKEGF